MFKKEVFCRFLLGDQKWVTGEEKNMLHIRRDLTGEMVYYPCDDETVRRTCQCNDPCHGDLAVKTDYLIESGALGAFLEMSDPESCRFQQYINIAWPWESAVRVDVLEIQSFVVYDYTGVIALFRREDGKFVPVKTYADGRANHQDYWKTVYPDPYERAVAKVRAEFFSDDSLWYFVGKRSGQLYGVVPKSQTVCMYESEYYFTNKVRDVGTKDGLDMGELCEWSEYGSLIRVPLKAIEGTDYIWQKLDTPEALLASALGMNKVGYFLTESGFYRILVDAECHLNVFKKAAAKVSSKN